jgi:TldD protein
MKDLADVALNAARQRGASYADMRISRFLNQFVVTREQRVQNVTNTESFGFGVRVLVEGAWGFAASSLLEKEEIARVTERAVSVARANKAIQTRPITLVPVEKYGEAKYNTPVKQDPFAVSLSEKADYLLKVNDAATRIKGAPGPMFVNSIMFFT